jgi:cell division initiation protein
MDVSPETIRTVEFRERLRGYNQDDVDQFLERMAAGVEILQQRLRDASQRAAQAEERPPQGDGDDTLHRTLALAQRTADLAVEEGREQAARLVQSAQGEAHSVVVAAQAEAEALLTDAQQRATALVDEAQGQISAEVQRLEARREQLGGEIVALERHLALARARAYTSLTDAARQIEFLVAEPAPSVAPEPIGPEPEGPPPTIDLSAPSSPDAPISEDQGQDREGQSHEPEPLAESPSAPSGPVPFQGASLQS